MVTNLGQGSYSMQNLHAGVNSYFEAFVGAAVPIKDFITIGARVKGLWGLVNASLEVTDTVVNITDEKVDARLAAEMVGCVPMIRSVVLPNGELNMDDIFAGGLNISQMLKDASNVGFAVDLGAEVRLLDDDLRLSAAITDMGFINWNKNSTLRGSVSGGVAYEGLNVSDIKEGVDVNFSSDEIVIKADDTLDGYSQRLNCQLNFGAEYAILNNHISFGLLSHTKFCRTFTYSELTTSVNFKPLNWITATVSHTFLNKNQPGVFGFAFNFHPAGLNLFVGADFIDLKFGQISSSMTPSGRLLLPVRQRSVNMHLGMAVSLGRAKYTKAYKADVEAGRAKPMPEKKSKSKSAKK